MSQAKTALIGHTGFVGSILKSSGTYTHFYNSSNIDAIRGEEFDSITCAGAPAAMWIANAEPEKDRQNIQRLMDCLSTVRAKRFFFISTVAVFQSPLQVNEKTPVNLQGITPYGLHRYELENFVHIHFAQSCVVRLPALFGAGLKKNALYDFIHDNNLDQVPMDGIFQWYNVGHLFNDLQRIADLPLVHLVPEPISMTKLVERLFPHKSVAGKTGSGRIYDVHTLYADRFGTTRNYIADAESTLTDLSVFVEEESRAMRKGVA